MRVALIGPVPPRYGGANPGGVATHQVHLAEALAQAEIAAPLLATNTCASPDRWRTVEHECCFPLYRMLRPHGINAAYVRAVGAHHAVRYAAHLARHRHAGSRREMLINLLAYRRFLAEVQPDVLHVQHPLERCLYARMVRRLEGWRMPLVVTAHSLFGEHPASHIQSLMRPNLLAADRVIAVSEHVAEQAISLGVDARRVRVIRSGIDATRFRPGDQAAARHSLGLPADARVVLFVGNLEPRKQVDVLLRAIARIRQAVPRLVLVVVGTGDNAGAQDQTAALRRQVADLDLGVVVRFVGRASDADLLDYYAAADVFALPSSSEAQGIVALEAMACGRPVVASRVGGLINTIEDGVTGFLVAAGDAAGLAGRLELLLRDSDRRVAMGAAARRAVEQRFSWQQAVAATREVYADVL